MPIIKRSIGTQWLKASEIGFGTMRLTAYGTPTSDDKSMKLIKRCLDHGVNLIDTAELYRSDAIKDRKLREKEKGEIPITNESVIGKAINFFGRNEFVVCTKHIPWGCLDKNAKLKMI